MISQSIVGYSPGRPEDDFYPTPEIATISLIETDYFDPLTTHKIWEPACGDGAISKVLNLYGFETISTDLYDHGYGTSGIDFRKTEEKLSDYIITNPPFYCAEDFVIHATELGINQFALLCKLSFLEGKKRSKILEENHLQRVLVFRKRLTMTRNGKKLKNSGMIAFAWFIFNRYSSNMPTIEWI